MGDPSPLQVGPSDIGTKGSGAMWPTAPNYLPILAVLLGGMAWAVCRDRWHSEGSMMEHGEVVRPRQPSARRRRGRGCSAETQSAVAAAKAAATRKVGPGSEDPDALP